LSTLDALKNDPEKARRFSIVLVFFCTVLGAAAQILMKAGTMEHPHSGALQLLVAIFQNVKLFLGYAFYGLSTLVLVIALKYGQLSILYPVIALTYVWVTGLSVMIYNESVNPAKLAGLLTVVLGVAVLGKGKNS
jgi:multidrug transporter EmrE-like cation transporter